MMRRRATWLLGVVGLGFELAKLGWSHLSKSYRSAIQSVIGENAAAEPGSARAAWPPRCAPLPVT